ncbi:hypothetical protein COCC4DRAFT_80893 [Bipolaris maydis ATCC 48331]|uniref:Uncharacterized protein n=2 Tax=Cochliobolus heterostrophus TaxID=5016 RepID=M2TWQ2_COCH5|nr:uncharacterized protein COCC4DRAFT_80893 [Bipolaris maydis ATCC 48331]EMD90944.1 hypothetical protein COCHEDRAFT_1137170 [Bipolaris maydis C5]KAH7560081.1 hypothetical protein BM1_03715 [Bipolaris maydis]ENI05972.1 hypothetical protein COCC4DRAFT_80893 [Bipolaris maydis ATCC 48331]KAJ5022681.1 hypothetical protein J3E73DRAFT_426507 [Bipolaris maydis]KAJ5064646.1 hypothetical protein J3E74DRAFT_263449 [Bipolaris maydis]
MATLAANDQENAVRHLHAAGGSKSLNAGIKGFNAKTPGNKAPKTPFKIPLNDENAVTKGAKSLLQTQGKGAELFTGGKGGKVDQNAFVTPAGPRMRAPLGMKTTNAKSKAFATPAPLSSAKTQKLSPRLRRPKVKVHQPEVAHESEDDVPEVEYMPPKEIPLEDDMDEYLPRNWTIPRISEQDMVRGIWQAYHNPIEDDGRTREQRKFEEELQKGRKQRDEHFEKIFASQMAKDDAEMREYYGIKEPKKEAAPRAVTSVSALRKAPTGPSTIRARSAAAALLPTSKPSYAAPTVAAKSRVPTGPVFGRKGAKTPTEMTASRQVSTSVVSKNTIGYAQGRAGRAAPAAARKPLSNVTKPAPFSAMARPVSTSHVRSASTSASTGRSRGPISRCSSTSTNATLVSSAEDEQPHRTAEDFEREMELLLLAHSDDEDDDAWTRNFSNQLHGNVALADEQDDDAAAFQLQLPEGF